MVEQQQWNTPIMALFGFGNKGILSPWRKWFLENDKHHRKHANTSQCLLWNPFVVEIIKLIIS